MERRQTVGVAHEPYSSILRAQVLSLKRRADQVNVKLTNILVRTAVDHQGKGTCLNIPCLNIPID